MKCLNLSSKQTIQPGMESHKRSKNRDFQLFVYVLNVFLLFLVLLLLNIFNIKFIICSPSVIFLIKVEQYSLLSTHMNMLFSCYVNKRVTKEINFN